ncbi:MAG: phosphatidylglycerophosphatase A [Candidatus Omnitrophica bacterium]|nr:phosphatidylglycerophosphatase A [Candidatus Omnitrophota bacterium]MBU1128830.1 phosphatidylglycerophosphatase A [Candidatus Omnitrophota bacterium]MBU1783777.1 phosphatidylglycerophosphatase A [Candidatus Omnitrophota bacterium]MBU1852130.1 phosphatidylglycerophosphatase A [Candidatus Omnitrophota bacterium]
MDQKISHNIATVFGLGKLPLAPGTWGSLAGLVLCVALHGHIVLYTLVFLCLFIIGVISAANVEADSDVRDPAYIVIDEFACIFPVFFLIPLSPAYVLAGFIIYRLMDIVKPPPIRKIEKLKGGWGIMLDDLVAAIYANIILHSLVYSRIF